MSHSKHPFYDSQAPAGPWDTIVVGSGMGGMTTAALLSKLGHKVLVLEQHYVPGGFTHTFKRKRWTWDVGVHAVGEVSGDALLGKIVSELTMHKLVWESLGPVYDEFYFPDLRVDFPDSRSQFAENLRQAFPGSDDEIAKYIASIREVSSTMRRYYLSRILPPETAPLFDTLVAGDAHRLLTRRTADVMAGLTQNPRLRTVLTAQWGYYGSPPKRSSYAVHALTAKHFFYGGYYPRGGSGAIAEGLLGTVYAHGGFTRINAKVKELILVNGRAAGVRLDDGEELHAKRVVSAMGAWATVQRLLPASERDKAWARSISSLPSSPCHVCLYLGFKGDIRKAGAGPANKWFYETWKEDLAAWDVTNPEAEAPILYTSFPSLKDPEHDPGKDELHTGEVVTFVPYDAFERWKNQRWRRRGEDYETFKRELTERLAKQFFRHMPALEAMTEWRELSTPLSTEYFTRAPTGAIYGLEPTPDRYRNQYLRPRTPVKELFLSGGDMASVGVMGAMVGGVLAASAIEPIKTFGFLKNLLGRR